MPRQHAFSNNLHNLHIVSRDQRAGSQHSTSERVPDTKLATPQIWRSLVYYVAWHGDLFRSVSDMLLGGSRLLEEIAAPVSSVPP